MTSRRSMATYSERMSRALQFVPGHVGGRVASAQPIRRRGGTLRSASVGAVAVPQPYAFASTINSMYSGTTFGPDTSDDLVARGLEDGDTIVFFANDEPGAIDRTFTNATGWTELRNGSIGGMSYIVSAVVYEAGVTSLTGFAVSAGASSVYGKAIAIRGNSGALPSVVDEVTAVASATSIAFAQPPTGTVLPFQVVLHHPSAGVLLSTSVTKTDYSWFYWGYSCGSWPAWENDEAGFGDPFPAGATVSHGTAGPWVSLCLGIAP